MCSSIVLGIVSQLCNSSAPLFPLAIDAPTPSPTSSPLTPPLSNQPIHHCTQGLELRSLKFQNKFPVTTQGGSSLILGLAVGPGQPVGLSGCLHFQGSCPPGSHRAKLSVPGQAPEQVLASLSFQLYPQFYSLGHLQVAWGCPGHWGGWAGRQQGRTQAPPQHR